MLLSEEQTMIRDMARDFAAEQLAPKAAEWDREARFPKEAIEAMGPLGLMGMLVPADWDGAGADNVSAALAVEEIAAGDGSVSTIMAVHNSVACMPILKFGTAEQKERFLRPLAKGEMLGCFCLTEPHAGSDASAIRTKAVKDGNKWRLSGSKQFITSGANADVAIVFAVTDPEAGKKGISAFIVPTDSKGYEVASVEKKMGQKASDTCHIVFDDVELTPDLMLGEEGQGYRIALSNLEGGRIGIAAQAIGMARAALDAAIAYAKERTSMGRAIAEHQAVAFRLAEMATKIEAARQMTLHAASLRDIDAPCLKEASMAKYYASEMAEGVVSDALQTFGGYGYVADYPVERIYRDVRACKIYEGTSDVQKLVIARQLLAA
ncbi:MAG: acyl-CoA dehydrogenase family protein [Marivibrio sp.]|uniref:acyl-CoA dehydrogenase family protein n=1 Tax=Marivibrio sp. TaxID=2039719 RepID=UPI0032F03FC5